MSQQHTYPDINAALKVLLTMQLVLPEKRMRLLAETVIFSALHAQLPIAH